MTAERPWVEDGAGGCRLRVRVVPRAARSELVGVDAQGLRVRLRAPPVDGKANAALLDLLAEALGVPRRAVTLAGGAAGRAKRVAVAGVTAGEARQRLGVQA
jgi:uncharacterized protein (TIGR00251 family)